MFEEHPETDSQEHEYDDESGRSWPYRTYRQNVQGGMWFWALKRMMSPPGPQERQGPFRSRLEAQEAAHQWIESWEPQS
jgi:hypothetical protein